MAEPFRRLLDTVVVCPATTEDEPTLVVRGERMVRIPRPSPAVRDALVRLRVGTFEAQEAGRDVRALVDVLTRLGWLTTEPARPESDQVWDRQRGWWSTLTADGAAAQDRLGTAEVAVLGLGGIGAPVAQHLAAGGVRGLWLLDHDVVATHNLNRQFLYTRADVGRPKTEAAAAALARINDAVRVRPTEVRVTASADLDLLPHHLDLLIVAADRPADLMDVVWAWAVPRGVPVLGAGVGLGTGYYGPLLDPRAAHCWPCFERARRSRLSADECRLESRGAPTPYSFGPTNAIVADHVARDALFFLAFGRCASLNRRLVLDVVGAGGALVAAGPDHCEHA